MKFKKSMTIKSKDKETTISITPHSIKVKYEDGGMKTWNADDCSIVMVSVDEEDNDLGLSINGKGWIDSFRSNDLIKLMNNIK